MEGWGQGQQRGLGLQEGLVGQALEEGEKVGTPLERGQRAETSAGDAPRVMLARCGAPEQRLAPKAP